MCHEALSKLQGLYFGKTGDESSRFPLDHGHRNPAANGHFIEIQGFDGSLLVYRLDIAASVKTTANTTFSGCSELKDMILTAESHVRDIHRFMNCLSLCRADIAALVECVADLVFSECSGLKDLISSVPLIH
jgi:hypothetical protein